MHDCITRQSTYTACYVHSSFIFVCAGSLFEEYAALAEFEAEDDSQISFKSGDQVLVMSKDDSGERREGGREGGKEGGREERREKGGRIEGRVLHNNVEELNSKREPSNSVDRYAVAVVKGDKIVSHLLKKLACRIGELSSLPCTANSNYVGYATRDEKISQGTFFNQ